VFIITFIFFHFWTLWLASSNWIITSQIISLRSALILSSHKRLNLTRFLPSPLLSRSKFLKHLFFHHEKMCCRDIAQFSSANSEARVRVICFEAFVISTEISILLLQFEVSPFALNLQ